MIALAPTWIEACFVLFPVCLKLWTVHASDSILFSMLEIPSKFLICSIESSYDTIPANPNFLLPQSVIC